MGLFTMCTNMHGFPDGFNADSPFKTDTKLNMDDGLYYLYIHVKPSRKEYDLFLSWAR